MVSRDGGVRLKICLSRNWNMFNKTRQLFLFSFIFISWKLITLQYCSGFCHTLTWISHGFNVFVFQWLQSCKRTGFKRPGFKLWVRKISLRREGYPLQHSRLEGPGQRSLGGYRPPVTGVGHDWGSMHICTQAWVWTDLCTLSSKCEDDSWKEGANLP